MKNFPQIAMFVIAGLVIAGNAQSFSPSAVDLPTLNYLPVIILILPVIKLV